MSFEPIRLSAGERLVPRANWQNGHNIERLCRWAVTSMFTGRGKIREQSHAHQVARSSSVELLASYLGAGLLFCGQSLLSRIHLE